MYWNNPLIEVKWPCAEDPIQDSLHQGQHCLFWNPAVEHKLLSTNQRLSELCRWANEWLIDGIVEFCKDQRNHYDIANIVKLNIWIDDIKKQGIVKPWIILDQGDGTYLAGTGESRMRALERIPEIQTIQGFVSTHKSRAHLYKGLEQITTLNRYAELCNAVTGQTFLFRLTDPSAPYGLYWYEYNTEKTRNVMPNEAQCVQAFYQYVSANPGIVISPEWFDSVKPWNTYGLV